MFSTIIEKKTVLNKHGNRVYIAEFLVFMCTFCTNFRRKNENKTTTRISGEILRASENILIEKVVLMNEKISNKLFGEHLRLVFVEVMKRFFFN